MMTLSNWIKDHLWHILAGFSFFVWHIYKFVIRLKIIILKEVHMKSAEIQILKDLVDQELPKLEAAEIARLPAEYGAIVSVIMSALGPRLQAALDAKIAEIPVDPAS
jgi:hypothetical protein